MAMTVETAQRRFSYQGSLLADPDPGLAPEQALKRLGYLYGEAKFATARLGDPELKEDGALVYPVLPALKDKG